MTDKQPEALRLAGLLELAPEDGVEPQTTEDAAAELRRLHADNEALASKLKAYEDLDEAASDVQLLRMGYAAARLEIESLQARIKSIAEERSDELTVAHLDGRMRAARPAGAQAAPAAGAVAGSGEVVAHRVMRKSISGEWASDARDWSDGPPSKGLIESVRADKGRWRIDVAYAAPTTQPAHRQEATEALARAEYYIDNPSAWSSFDQRISDDISAVTKALRAALTTPQQEAQEPVAWQRRTRPTWDGDNRPWSHWEPCTKGQAEDCWKTPLLHDWAYEARALYTVPKPSPASQGDENA